MLKTYTIPLPVKNKIKQLGYDEIDRVRELRFWKTLTIISWLITAIVVYLWLSPNKGGVKTNHPYGISTHYKHISPHQACINIIKSAIEKIKRQRGLRYIWMKESSEMP